MLIWCVTNNSIATLSTSSNCFCLLCQTVGRGKWLQTPPTVTWTFTSCSFTCRETESRSLTRRCTEGGKTSQTLNVCLLLFVRPNWLKKLFTNFISFTVKMAVKRQVRVRVGWELDEWEEVLVILQSESRPHWYICFSLQICGEINKAANILADFIQDTAGMCPCVSDYCESMRAGFSGIKCQTITLTVAAKLTNTANYNRVRATWQILWR